MASVSESAWKALVDGLKDVAAEIGVSRVRAFGGDWNALLPDLEAGDSWIVVLPPVATPLPMDEGGQVYRLRLDFLLALVDQNFGSAEGRLRSRRAQPGLLRSSEAVFKALQGGRLEPLEGVAVTDKDGVARSHPMQTGSAEPREVDPGMGLTLWTIPVTAETPPVE